MTTTTAIITTAEGNTTVLTCGSRKAILAPLFGGWSVWVGYASVEGDTPALWFKGYRTCGAEYKTWQKAREAAVKFLNA